LAKSESGLLPARTRTHYITNESVTTVLFLTVSSTLGRYSSSNLRFRLAAAGSRAVASTAALTRPLPALRHARWRARLIGAEFSLYALVELVQRIGFVTDAPVAPPVGAQKSMCVRPHTALELTLGESVVENRHR
jgi:hypothetical protein